MRKKDEPAETDGHAHDVGDEAGAARAGGSGNGRSRWGAMFGLVIAVGLVLLLLVLHLTGVLGPRAH